MKNKTIFVLAIILTVFMSACSKKETINVAGSTTVLPVVSNAAEQFKAKHFNE